MSAITLTVKHHFSAGHRIPGLGGAGAKCTNLHGHTFGVEWTFAVYKLDASELEFASCKATLRSWVDTHLDHGYLVAPSDSLLIDFLASNGFKYHLVSPVPTTEAIADMLREVAVTFVPARCMSVKITEGPHNEAEVFA